MLKSIKQQYIDLREGNMSQANFMRNLRMTLPQYVTNVTSFDDSIRILKNKGILTEADIKISPETADKLKKAIDSITADNSEYHRDGYTMGFFEGEDIKEKEEGKEMSESYYDSDPTDGDRDFDMEQRMKADEYYDKGEQAYLEGDLSKAERYYQAALKAGSWLGWGERELPPYGDKSINENISDADIMKKYNEMFGANPQTKFVDVAKALNIPEDQVASALQSGAMPKFGLKEAKDNSSEGKYKTVNGKDLYAHFKEIDNLNGQEVLIGIDWEMQCNPELTKLEAQKIVIKKLKKNPIYYTSWDMSGVEGYEPEYIGGKSADPKAHQMKPVKGNDMVDKARGMKPVKDIEKPKKDADARKETNKPVKGVDSMSLIAKAIRGLKKMDATGEKMKKVSVKENFQTWLSDKKGEEAAEAAASESHNGLKRGNIVMIDSEIANKLGIEPDSKFEIIGFTSHNAGKMLSSTDAILVDVEIDENGKIIKRGTNKMDINVEYLEASLNEADLTKSSAGMNDLNTSDQAKRAKEIHDKEKEAQIKASKGSNYVKDYNARAQAADAEQAKKDAEKNKKDTETQLKAAKGDTMDAALSSLPKLRERLKDIIRKELKEMAGAYGYGDAMNAEPEDGSSYLKK